MKTADAIRRYIAFNRRLEEADPEGVAEFNALVAKHYKWWTVSASANHLKFGTVTFCWYRWGFEVVALCRYSILRIGWIA